MRRELILVFLAISGMIVIAFVVPLGLSARSTAIDTAMDRAAAQTAVLVPQVARDNRQTVVDQVNALNAEGRFRFTVVMADGSIVGWDRPVEGRLAQTIAEATSLSGAVGGGRELTTAVSLSAGRTAAVAVLVPDAELTAGVWSAWLTLGALALVLVLLAVGLADRMASRIIGPAERLAAAAAALGDRDFAAEVEPEGPSELAATAEAFNRLVRRVQEMLNEERALMAELAHRLRTPLARLRIDIEQITDPELAERLDGDVKAVTSEVNDLIARARHRIDPPVPLDLTALVKDRFEFWSVLAEEEGRSCRFDGNDPVIQEIDRDDAEVMVDTLLENVFAHTKAGVSFAVAVNRTESGCSIVVEDAGPGFDPSLAAPGHSDSGSTGLGLAIVARLLSTYGGTLSVGRSELGGARIEGRLPSPRSRP
ncbi:MAG: HAMP domain-containing protein [Acidimicrobiia bacterium]|nr:HAMP domain-containing protein [Acidimicrobiia bacterium]